ncbi:MAG: efflux RND transporter periplasmic adaptor subunit [Pseudomonadales bacterium]|nr:efflux RND transporter periplasmic adaptor subunit [Pseudomonadales bacterium]
MPVRSLLLAAFLYPAWVIAAQGPPPAAVLLEPVRSGPIADPLEALGTLRANETVRITAQVSDVIAAIHFRDGQRVKAGALLVQMSDAEEAALLLEAQSLADEAERQYQRVRSLVEQGTAARSLLDERQRESQTAQARVTAVRSRLEDRIITAPFAGVVGLRQVSPGALVAPGELITTLVDDSTMKLDFTIPSLYLSSVSADTVVQATTQAFPGETFTGIVSSVDSVVNPVTRSITVRALIPNTDHRLVPGMLMTLELQRGQRQALLIAEEAIVPRGDRTFVYVVNTTAEQPTAEQREVQLGARLPGRVEVISGLTEGEMIVKHGTFKLRPGAPVRIRAVDDGSEPISELITSKPAGPAR